MFIAELFLNEAFDQPYPIKWEKGEFGDYDALATLGDGTYLSIMFNQEEDGEYQIEFHRNHSQDVTGEGDAQRVFATVLTAIQQFIEQQHPERIRFSAAKDDDGDNQSRSKLYDRLIQRYASSWGYSVDISDYAGSTVYLLTNDLNEVVKMPPVNMVFSNENLVDWAYNDAQEKQARQLSALKTDVPTRVYDMGDHVRVFVIDDQGPVLYLALEKFLDGFKTNAVQIRPRGQGKNLAFKTYQAVSDTFKRPLYSDYTHTDASRLGIWKKLINQFPERMVGYDQRTKEDLPLSITPHGPAVRGNQPVYAQRGIKDQSKPVTGDVRSRTRLLKFLPTINEVTLVPTVAKSKRQHLDVMPNDGRPIPAGDERHYLGELVAEMPGSYELWSWTSYGLKNYYVFDTETRTSQLATSGRSYPDNHDSFVVAGTYSGPKNRMRAADLYAFLILKLGVTLVSDNKQSAGGYRVWQELEQRYGKKINIHGFDTRTNEPVNVTTQDEPDTHVDRAAIKSAGPKMKKELGTVSRDLRFVASAR
jgi:hypothetical protein